MKKPAALMFQGTGSDVGKSLIVAGLCRLLTDRGLIVRPFKPQNMSNNAAVTVDGGEIGRAQALQARAARTLPTVDMNPVLLKPQSATGAQLIVGGRMRGAAGARDYQRIKASLLPDVLASFARLRAGADLVLVEGAGSASEINLRANDIANMGFARAAEVPVIVIGDIDRGGVIASLVGTHAVLDPADRAIVAGFIVNRMRGDPSLFAAGMEKIAAMTGWRPIGLVPHLPDAARLPAEDGLALSRAHFGEEPAGAIRVAIPVLPHIANFDEFDPLAHDPRFTLRFLKDGTPLPGDTDLVILAGAKATIADLAALRAAGWEVDIAAHVRRGGHVLGICGGYQMLGRSIADPLGLEGPAGEVAGLGLIDVASVLKGEKRLAKARGTFAEQTIPVAGYEMHVGETTGPATARPLIRLDDGRADGALSSSSRIAGTYLHGIFAGEPARDWLAARFGRAGQPSFSYEAEVDAALDRLAAHLAAHLDIEALLKAAR